MAKIRYGFAVISKESNVCTQTLSTTNGNWRLNNDTHYSIVVDVANVCEYVGKYYYNSQWWERVWSEVDENGIPVEGATYTDSEWTPDGNA